MIQKHPTQFTTPDDSRFNTTDYVVIASFQEAHYLWREWHHIYGVAPWEEERGGWARHIASLDGHPLWVDVQWALIGGKRVAFASVRGGFLVDESLVDEWCCAVFRCLRDINQRSSRRTNAANFNNVLLRIKQGGSLVIRDFDEVQRSLKSIEAKPWL